VQRGRRGEGSPEPIELVAELVERMRKTGTLCRSIDGHGRLQGRVRLTTVRHECRSPSVERS
jgi:hypothetical protein